MFLVVSSLFTPVLHPPSSQYTQTLAELLTRWSRSSTTILLNFSPQRATWPPGCNHHSPQAFLAEVNLRTFYSQTTPTSSLGNWRWEWSELKYKLTIDLTHWCHIPGPTIYVESYHECTRYSTHFSGNANSCFNWQHGKQTELCLFVVTYVRISLSLAGTVTAYYLEVIP